MDLIKKYGKLIRKKIPHPKTAQTYLKVGLDVALRYVSLFPDRRLPGSLQFLQKICLKNILEHFNDPHNSVWVNIFAPTEILHAMELRPLFIEAYSSFMSGFHIEDELIEAAESAGISNSLCSFHKVFLGSGELGLLQKSKMSMTTSMICDGNISTFRYLSQLFKQPLYILDIPFACNKETVNYVKNQLQEMLRLLEKVFRRKLDMDKLRETLICENETRKLIREYLHHLGTKNLPTTMTIELYTLFTSHVLMGKEETRSFYRMLLDDMRQAPLRKGKGIFFIHIPPLYEKNFMKYFNLNAEFPLLGFDLHYDYLDEIDYRDPLEGIARKLLLNSYNGSFNRRMKLMDTLLDTVKPHGVIQFCHFGCKQSIGGTHLVKELLNEKNIPFLTLDGDVIHKKNNQEGPNRTRLEAFLEIVQSR